MKLEELSNEELLELYELTYREVSEVSEEQQSGRGVGANIYPIMNVIPRTEAKAPPAPVMTVYCPGKNATNAFRSLPDPTEQLAQATVKAVSEMMGNEVAAIVAETITVPVEVTPTPSTTPLLSAPSPDVEALVSQSTPTPTPTAPEPTASAPAPTPTPSPQPTPTPSPTPTPTPTPDPSPGGGYY